jgi:hypothetical protein
LQKILDCVPDTEGIGMGGVDTEGVDIEGIETRVRAVLFLIMSLAYLRTKFSHLERAVTCTK